MTKRYHTPRTLQPVPFARADGFTLLETLISLAILSVVSLALFQSTSALLRITDRAVFAGERTLESGIARKTFRSAIGGLTPAWAEAKQDVFRGNGTRLSGLSTGVPSASGQGLQKFSLSLAQNDDGKIALMAAADGQTWALRELPVQTVKFLYLGADQNWYEAWPPRDIPSPGFFDDALYMDMPQLPLAVRLSGEGQDKRFDWVARVLGDSSLPYREEF